MHPSPFAFMVAAALCAATPLAAQTAGDAPSTAGAPASSAAQVEMLLSAHHGLPPREAFEAIEGARAELWRLLEDPQTFGVFRDRALLALGYWPDNSLRAWLESHLATATGEHMLDHNALLLYAEHWTDAAATERVASFLRSTDVQLRLSALAGLELQATPQALDFVRQAAALEQNPVVLERLSDVERAIETRVGP